MLKSEPTKSGTGISIYGTYDELDFLYMIVHKIADVLNENNEYQRGQHMLLMNFAYEIRKAKDQSRLIEKSNIDGVDITVYGFQIVWTDMMIFLSTLRYNAGYTSLDKLEQSVLYMLEFIVEDAARRYDAEGALKLEPILKSGLYIGHKYVFQIYQTIHSEFISKTKGKRRFRNISNFLWLYLSPLSQDHLGLIDSLEFSAKKHNCNVFDLEIRDFPEIVW